MPGYTYFGTLMGVRCLLSSRLREDVVIIKVFFFVSLSVHSYFLMMFSSKISLAFPSSRLTISSEAAGWPQL